MGDFRLTIKRSQRLLMGPLLRRLLNLEDTMEFGLKKAKLFLVFVAICATTTATPIPTTNANGASMSAFLTNLKQGLENLLGMVQHFEMEQSTQINQTTPKILVVGGDDTRMKTELWPGSKTQCDLPDFPIEIRGAVGFNTAKGPVICGGEGENRCFLLKQHQWMPFSNMTTSRTFASATEVNNDQTLIIGGYDENGNDLQTTELISSSGSVKGKDFPTTIYSHCSFKINSTHALVTGGRQDGSYSASTWFVDLTTTTVTPGPKMTSARSSHSCSTFNLGRKTFGVVAGGYDYPNVLDSTEWIDLEEDSATWTEGPKLPRGLWGHTLVESTQGTYALGGYDGSNNRSEVFQLDCPGNQIQSCQWQEMPEKLEFGRVHHVSLSLPESYDICD